MRIRRSDSERGVCRSPRQRESEGLTGSYVEVLNGTPPHMITL